MNLIKKILELLYPHTCCFCGKAHVEGICEECREEIVDIQEPRCKACGKPILSEEKEYCADCERQPIYYEQGKNLWVHKGKVSRSIYQFKYHNRRIYGKTYALELFRRYGTYIKAWKIDVILPIPIHVKRRRKRGYNQTEIIAKELAMLTGIPMDLESVKRIQDTRPQKELDQRERRQNLQKAFVLKKIAESPRRILLIDDIYTTGATINAVAKLLSEKEGSKVWFLTISIGQDF